MSFLGFRRPGVYTSTPQDAFVWGLRLWCIVFPDPHQWFSNCTSRQNEKTLFHIKLADGIIPGQGKINTPRVKQCLRMLMYNAWNIGSPQSNGIHHLVLMVQNPKKKPSMLWKSSGIGRPFACLHLGHLAPRVPLTLPLWWPKEICDLAGPSSEWRLGNSIDQLILPSVFKGYH